MKFIDDEFYNVNFLHKVPSWIIRYGNTVFALFLIFLVFFSHFFSFNTIVTTDALISNVNSANTRYEGEIKIPSKEKNKIKIDQNVLIKLTDFPFEEFGSLNGKIREIREEPLTENGTYFIGYVTIDSMVTNHNKTITAEYKMIASADIMVEEMSILQRIFYQFRDIWSPN